MALCINQSGTWRCMTSLCVNQSGTWRNIQNGYVNQSGTWRQFLISILGSSCCGGFIFCRSANINWIISPFSAEVVRSWYQRNDAITRAQQVSPGSSGWFIPTCVQWKPAWCCCQYWDGGSPQYHWSNTEVDASTAYVVFRNYALAFNKNSTSCVRAFRCVAY